MTNWTIGNNHDIDFYKGGFLTRFRSWNLAGTVGKRRRSEFGAGQTAPAECERFCGMTGQFHAALIRCKVSA
jgi:hypothetical protein